MPVDGERVKAFEGRRIQSHNSSSISIEFIESYLAPHYVIDLNECRVCVASASEFV